MIEVAVRAIPKEEASAKLYRDTAKIAIREMNRMLFEKLASQSEEHATKLKATLQILKKELDRVRKGGVEAATPEVCTPAHEFNVNIRQTMRIASEMKKLAQKGISDANDPSCQEMYQTILEMSQKIRELAAQEIDSHIVKDKWD